MDDISMGAQLKFIRFAVLSCLLMALWLASLKLAGLLDFFPHSSLWFLPAGVTLSVALVAPGHLKLAPFAANLLLGLPWVGTLLSLETVDALTQTLHSIRHFAIYGGSAYVLAVVGKVHFPIVSVRDTQWVVVVCIIAALCSALTGVSLHVVLDNMSWSEARDVVVRWAIGDDIGAIVVPPLLVPLLAKVLARPLKGWQWPSPASWVMQVLLIASALAIGTLAPRSNAALDGLWYLTILPPIIMAVKGGMPTAATSAFLTSLVTPPAAYVLAYNGDPLPLSLLLLIGSVAGLLIGGAISERHSAFLDIETQRAELEKTVQNRTKQLSAAFDFQRHLIRSLGYDLRQPLQTMNLMLDGLAIRTTDGDIAAAVLQTRQIGATASALLTSIVNYAKFDPGHLTPHASEFSVQQVFTALQQIYGPVAEAKGVFLRVEISDATLVSDEQLIAQAIANDLDNALRLSQSGMTVTLRHSHGPDGHAFLVRDEIEMDGTGVSGIAGFGHSIVEQIAELLGATLISEKNERGLRIQGSCTSK